jgi:hypothetical protein
MADTVHLFRGVLHETIWMPLSSFHDAQPHGAFSEITFSVKNFVLVDDRRDPGRTVACGFQVRIW